MKFKILSNLEKYVGTILIPVFETHEKSLIPTEFHGVSVPSNVFYGKKDTHYIIEKYDCTHVFIGIGTAINYKDLKNIFRRIAAKQQSVFSKNVAIVFPDLFTEVQCEAAISGLLLGTYNLGHYKKEAIHPFLKDDFELDVITNHDYSSSIIKGIKIAKAQLETFALVDLPPNKITPEYLSKWAKESGIKYGFKTSVFNQSQCIELGLDAFVAVGKGSSKEMQFIIMEYNPTHISDKTKHVGLVGKGITFDTGGLNIKTAGMVHMKCDMAGGGAVFGTMQLIADLNLDVKVTAIVPCCENAVDNQSFLPSDVINSYAGHSIEIIDTDAEGRLILVDGLSYLIKNYNPEIIVDIATLTGSSVATFGSECGALFSNNNQLAQYLQKSGDEVGERLWQLPLWESYKSDIDSEIADVKNYSGKPVAGAISAAKFLEFFTENHQSWAHIDIAGMAFIDDEFAKTKHASAFGVHLLTQFMQNL